MAEMECSCCGESAPETERLCDRCHMEAEAIMIVIGHARKTGRPAMRRLAERAKAAAVRVYGLGERTERSFGGNHDGSE